VIVGEDDRALDRCRAHEHVHVRQAERWGPLFILAYLAAGLWAHLRGRHHYHDNPFEAEARKPEIEARKQGAPSPADALDR
jgi:hypothetical protein